MPLTSEKKKTGGESKLERESKRERECLSVLAMHFRAICEWQIVNDRYVKPGGHREFCLVSVGLKGAN